MSPKPAPPRPDHADAQLQQPVGDDAQIIVLTERMKRQPQPKAFRQREWLFFTGATPHVYYFVRRQLYAGSR